ncbi:MAG: Tol-Pal system beta propeller repeat protein TolB [Alphaproteobacteria bacterium]|nr:Tol-Pal system beta propeller repeat protein TolB [Alphaproteobacteria bacterium]MCB9792601.1 Tol-Pal system beta propeller repeat protein TolB [Alphaproteobacteria bacterium]
MRRLLAALLTLLATVALLRGPDSHAQDGPPKLTLNDVVIDISRPGGQDLPIALPKPVGGAGDAELIWEIVRRDLEASGYFKVIDPAAFIEPSGAGLQPGQFQYEDWEIPGAVVLAKTKVEPVDTSLRAEVWVYDVPGRRKLGAKAFTTEVGQARRVGHRIADEIIYQVTGEPGIFATRFAAISSRTGNKEVVIFDTDGHGVTPITANGAINLQPAWSPDGGKIAYTSYAAGNPDTYIADLAKGRITRVSNRVGVNTGAAFHPKGTPLALTLTSGAAGDTDIFTIDPVTGAKIARLTNAPGIDVGPSWSPDGTQIAFASERSGGLQIYVMGVDGSGARRVSFQGNHNADPSWSPRGDRIAFVGRDGNFDVFTVGTDGKGMLRITQGEGDNEDPTWSPDGRYLAFTSTRSGGRHVWMSTADGRHQTQVTQGSGVYSNPAWSPRTSW